MNRLPAFTLIELLVAMAVSGIVIAAGYVSYGMMTRHYLDFRSHTDATSQVVVLKGILGHDINLAKTVKRYSPDEIVIVQNDNTTVNYEWNENYVLRKNPVVQDTFFLPVKKSKMSFLDSEQIKAEGIIDELMLTTLINGKEFIIYFDKQYGSDILMEIEKLEDGRH